MCFPDRGAFNGEESDLRSLHTLAKEERELSDALKKLKSWIWN